MPDCPPCTFFFCWEFFLFAILCGRLSCRPTELVYKSFFHCALNISHLSSCLFPATLSVTSHSIRPTLSALMGATENARHENTGRSKMQDLKMRDMNLRHQFARVENAGKFSMESQSVKKCLKVVVFVCRVIPSV